MKSQKRLINLKSSSFSKITGSITYQSQAKKILTNINSIDYITKDRSNILGSIPNIGIPTTTSTTTTTTTPNPAGPFFLSVYMKYQQNSGNTVDLDYSLDLGQTWNPYFGNTIPSYTSYSGPLGAGPLEVGPTDTVYFAVTNGTSNQDVSYGTGFNSVDYTSLCGKSNPLIISNVSSNQDIYFNVAISATNLVNCTTTTTSTTTTTTTI